MKCRIVRFYVPLSLVGLKNGKIVCDNCKSFAQIAS